MSSDVDDISETGGLTKKMSETAGDKRLKLLKDFVLRELREILFADKSAGAEVDPDFPLRDLGLNSLKTMRFINRIKDVLGPELEEKFPVTVIFNYPTANAIVGYLAGEVYGIEKKLEQSAAVGKVTTIDEPIAIVGMGCRFPGGVSDPEALWKFLKDGGDGITDVPLSRWDASDLYSEDRDQVGKVYVKKGGFVKDVEGFDAAFFGISPKEATALDPQHRFLLEVVWEALEDAAIVPRDLSESKTGVYIGITNKDYAELIQASPARGEYAQYIPTGNNLNTASGRISYFLGLHGPSISVDTACSSSIVALHLACQSLRSGDSSLAIVGGVNLMLTPTFTIELCRMGALSADGYCKTFDESADGYVRSDGCGVLILKPLSRALADGNYIYSVVEATALNQDGKSSGLSAPNGLAQEMLFAECVRRAGIQPSDVSYIEAHGTGTPLGDPIETQAIGKVYGQGRTASNPLWVGSIKTNIGHTESAAGVAGIIKASLSIVNRQIPAHLHFRKVNPNIRFDQMHALVPNRLTDWNSPKRRAGISSFGISGTNSHVILCESPTREAQSAAQTTQHVLCISGKNEQARRDLVKKYIDYFDAHPDVRLVDVCMTAAAGRSHFEERMAIVGTSVEDIKEKLLQYFRHESATEMQVGTCKDGSRKKIAFMFSGQGSQYLKMGETLYAAQPAFRATIDRCEQILSGILSVSLKQILFTDSGLLGQTRFTQPALFALEYSLFEMWKSWGLNPDIVVGHSVGECVAACAAGMFSLEDGLRLIAKRAELMQSAPGDGMMAVIRGKEGLIDLLKIEEPLAIASINSSNSLTISGPKSALEPYLIKLEEEGCRVSRLNVMQAFHSSQMDGILAEYESFFKQIKFISPKIPVVSNLSGQLAGEEMLKADYWSRQIREPVRFSDCIRTVIDFGCTDFVEIGPDSNLTVLARASVEEKHQVSWILSLRKKKDDVKQIAVAVAAFFAGNIAFDWNAYFKDLGAQKIPGLPTYAFQHLNFWIEKSAIPKRSEGRMASSPMLGSRLDLAGSGEIVFQSVVSAKSPSFFVGEHYVFETGVVPATAYIDMVVSGAREAAQGFPIVIENMTVDQALTWQGDDKRLIQLRLTPEETDKWRFQIFSQAVEKGGLAPWETHSTGRVKVERNFEAPAPRESIDDIRQRCGVNHDVSEFYRILYDSGLQLGHCFRGITGVQSGDGEAIARVELQQELVSENDSYSFHPAHLDSCQQVFTTIFTIAAENKRNSRFYLPVQFDKIIYHRNPPHQLWSHVVFRSGARLDGKSITGDILIVDDENNPIVEYYGLSMIEAPREALQRLARRRESFGDWLYQEKWIESKIIERSPKPAEKSPETVVFFVDKAGVGKELMAAESAKGNNPIAVSWSHTEEVKKIGPSEFAIDPSQPEQFLTVLNRIGDAAPIRRIAHLWSLDSGEVGQADFNGDLQLIYGSGLSLVQALLKGGKSKEIKVSFITMNAEAIHEQGRNVRVEQSLISGLVKTIAMEVPEVQCMRVDIGSSLQDGIRGFDARLIQALSDELDEAYTEAHVCLRGGAGEVTRFVSRIDRKKAKASDTAFAAQGTYLITGGLGGVGLKVAQWLAENEGVKSLILVGRSSANEAALQVIEKIRKSGTTVEVCPCDVTKYSDVERVVALTKSGLPELRGIVHAAGVIEDALIVNQNWEKFVKVMSPKILGAWNLHLATQALRIDRFVLFSSTTALLGAVGQANYAAANAWLDSFAQFRRHLNLPAQAINWGAWAGGMASALIEKGNVSELGLEIMEPEKSLKAFSSALRSEDANLCIAPINWSKFAANVSSRSQSSFLSLMLGGPSRRPESVSAGAQSELVRKISQASKEDRKALVQNFLLAEVRKILGNESLEIDLRQGLMSAGFDSLMGIEFRNRIKKAVGEELGKKIKPTLIFNYPTLEVLTEFLLNDVFIFDRVAATPTEKAKKAPSNRNEPIAIVGIACRFPKANSPEEYWKVIREGQDATSEIPKARWDIDRYFDADKDAPGKMYVRRGGFIEGVDQFDPLFFNISPKEAVITDPQQRLLMEVSWEAFENAGESVEDLFGSPTGVFLGMSNLDYRSVLKDSAGGDQMSGTVLIGNSFSISAGRLSYTFGFEGPAFTIDTACSASLVALDLACESLRKNESNVALVAGVNATIHPETYIGFCKMHALSPDGVCKTFDASADGYARGEGCGALVLKRLSDAKADGNQILALIKGSAVNQDGRSSSLTAPSGKAQELVISEALRRGDVSPLSVGYIEAHGTGTPLGDPIEVGSIGKVYGEGRKAETPLFLGSAKSNIGHLEAAAGVAGIIKVVLSLMNKKIPPVVHFTELNPNIGSLDSMSAVIPTQLTDWPSIGGKRIAGVSAFAMSGTNAHVILEEAPTRRAAARGEVSRPSHVLCLSGKEPGALKDLAEKYVPYLEQTSALIEDVCFTAGRGRSHFEHRLSISGGSKEEIVRKLNAFAKSAEVQPGVRAGKAAGGAKLAFLFTGQGSQYVGMGQELYDRQPAFKAGIDACEEILKKYQSVSLKEVLFNGAGLIDQTEYTQVALFAIEYALAEMWKSFGVEPFAVMGHSVGEYVAATVAGVISLEDGLKLIYHRGRLMSGLAGHGTMASIAASEERVKKAIEGKLDKVSIGAINGPQSVVVSGDYETVREIVSQFEKESVKVKLLNVSHGFHSPQMTGMLDEFEKIASDVKLNKPKIRYISNVSGKKIEDELTPGYWRQHVREAVRFADGMNALEQEGVSGYLEIGPGTTLLGMGRLCVSEERSDAQIWLSSLRKDASDYSQVADAFGGLYVHGMRLSWQAWEKGFGERRRVEAPTYAFQNRRYWVEGFQHPRGLTQKGLLGHRIDTSTRPTEHIFELELTSNSPAYLKDHQVYGQVVVPGSAYVEMALTTIGELAGSAQLSLKRIEIQKAMMLESAPRTVQVIAESAGGSYQIQILSRLKGSEEAWDLHALCDAEATSDPSNLLLEEFSLEELRERFDGAGESSEEYYQIYSSTGLDYGPSFQGLRRVWRAADESLVEVELPAELSSKDYKFHPALLDACFQSMAGCFKEEWNKAAFLPVGIKEFHYIRTPESKVYVHALKKFAPKGTSLVDIRIFTGSGELIGEIADLTGVETKVEALSSLKTKKAGIDDWFYEVKWEEQAFELRLTEGQKPGRWLIFADKKGFGEKLADEVKKVGDEAILVAWNHQATELKLNASGYELNPSRSDQFEKLLEMVNSERPLRQVVHMWSMDCAQLEDLGDFELDQALSYGSALNLTQTMIKRRYHQTSRLSFVTRGAAVVQDNERIGVEQATVWGLSKVISLECPALKCLRIDLPESWMDAMPICNEISNEGSEDQIAYRLKATGSLTRYVARLERRGETSVSLEGIA